MDRAFNTFVSNNTAAQLNCRDTQQLVATSILDDMS
jgi:hypothetical protein